MKKNDVIKLILIYIILFIFGSICYVLSFHTFLFKFIDVFFYRGIALIILWGIIITLLMIFLRQKFYKAIITVRDIILLFALFCSMHLVFFTHLPVTAERSISVFMLGYMADNPEQIYSEEDIKEYFIDKYVNEYQAFSKRFHEQIRTGTIKKVGDGYQITSKGKTLMKIYDLVADMYNIDKKLIHSSK